MNIKILILIALCFWGLNANAQIERKLESVYFDRVSNNSVWFHYHYQVARNQNPLTKKYEEASADSIDKITLTENISDKIVKDVYDHNRPYDMDHRPYAMKIDNFSLGLTGIHYGVKKQAYLEDRIIKTRDVLYTRSSFNFNILILGLLIIVLGFWMLAEFSGNLNETSPKTIHRTLVITSSILYSLSLYPVEGLAGPESEIGQTINLYFTSIWQHVFFWILIVISLCFSILEIPEKTKRFFKKIFKYSVDLGEKLILALAFIESLVIIGIFTKSILIPVLWLAGFWSLVSLIYLAFAIPEKISEQKEKRKNKRVEKT